MMLPWALRRGPLYIVLLVGSVLWLLPLLVVLSGAVNSAGGGFSLIPQSISLHNFSAVLAGTNLPRLLLNSAIVTVASTGAVVFLGSVAAYGFVRHPFPGGSVVLFIVLTGLMLAPAAVIIPLYTEVQAFSLLNNYLGLIGPYAAFGVPVSVLLFRNAFSSLPSEVLDAARVDGASVWRTYSRVAMPLCLPTIATVAILQGVTSWNEYLLALLVMTSPSHQTVQLAWTAFAGEFATQQGKQFAVLTLVMLPVIATYLASQRWLIGGLTSGAVNK